MENNSSCVVCGASVSKPKSYSYKGGRACRIHPEVEATHKQHELQEKNRILKAIAPKKQKQYNKPSWDVRDPKTFCWCCNREYPGIGDRYFEAMIAHEKFILQKQDRNETFNIFDMLDAGNKVFAEGGPVLVRIDLVPSEVVRMSRSCHRLNFLVQMTSMIIACTDCVRKYQLKVEIPEITNEQLKAMMVVQGIIKPELEAMAREELRQESSGH